MNGVNPKIWLVMAVVLLGMVGKSFGGKTIYVDDDAKGLNNGTSWDDAYKFLQDALADANSAEKPVEIRVAQGIYKPDEDTLHPDGTGDRTASFQLINGVTIKGGYAGPRMSLSGADPNAIDIKAFKTILSGDLNGDDVEGIDPSELFDHPNRSDNSYHIFYHPQGLNLDHTAVLDGFTITGGNLSYQGGGMYNEYSSPTINKCIFTENWAEYGGGMDNWGSSPTVTKCTFSNNSADHGGGMDNYTSSPMVNDCTFNNNSANVGGGMYNYYDSGPNVMNCIFNGNSATLGGGMCNYKSSPTVTNCTFTTNSAINGGGMGNGSYSSPNVNNCKFSTNSSRYGGGMYNYESSPNVNICKFSGNSAEWDGGGGGMYNYYRSSPHVNNCMFTANSADEGGGMGNYYDYGNSPIVNNCAFSGNLADYGGGMYNEYSSPILTNCILWADAPTEISGYGYLPIVTVTYSDVQGGWSGVGNINADPRFVNPGIGDHHLLPVSPCINAGDPSYLAGPNETDMDGELRVMLGRVDMGADEFNPFEVTFEVVNKKRIDRTVFEYDCEVTLTNISRFAMRNVQLEIVKASDNMVIIEPNLVFGDIEIGPGESAISIDTCTFQVDRSEAIKPAEIIWWCKSEMADTGQTEQYTSSSIVILEPEAATGDLTGEGKIDLEDLEDLASQWLWVGSAGGIPEDITSDGIVNLRDFAVLAATPQ